MKAPRHEAGFRVIFGPQNDALQMGYGAENIALQSFARDAPFKGSALVEQVSNISPLAPHVPFKPLCMKHSIESIQTTRLIIEDGGP